MIKLKKTLGMFYETLTTFCFFVHHLLSFINGNISLNGAKLINCRLKTLNNNYKLIFNKHQKFVNCSFMIFGECNKLIFKGGVE